MRVLAVVGARPQFVKAAVFEQACADAGIQHELVHTGQHYDHALSRAFFEDLGISKPAANLGVGSASHAQQTGEMMRRFDVFLDGLDYRPDWIVVFGDTNSTLAASLVASKRRLRLAHVEAGLRSYDTRMPEEINRVLVDRISTLLFCPTQQSVANLFEEGIQRGVLLTGDIMYDSVLRYKDQALQQHTHPLANDPFHLVTIHREENTDDRNRLVKVLACLGASTLPVLWPMHPRTRERLSAFELSVPGNVTVMEPLGYLAMLAYLQFATRIITDSGGLQKEAYWLGTPCITLRSATEWPETLEGGWNVLVDLDAELFSKELDRLPTLARSTPYGDGQAGSAMVRHMMVHMDAEGSA